jgi:hypothetical protein
MDAIDPITGQRRGLQKSPGPAPQITQLLVPKRVEPPTGWSELWAEQISRYRAAGLSVEQCAELSGTTTLMLENYFQHELTNGKQITVAKVAGKLMQKALEGDNTCIIFYLKSQGMWREVTRLEHTGADGKPIATMGVTLDATDLTQEQRAVLRLALEKSIKGEPETEPEPGGDDLV